MRRSSRSWLWVALGLSIGAVIAFLVGWPLLEMFTVASEQPNAAAALTDALVSDALRNTLVVGSLVAIGCTVAGAGVAFLTERTGVVGRRWLRLSLIHI